VSPAARQKVLLPYDARAAVRHLKRVDERMAGLIEQVGPFRLELKGQISPYESLSEAIVYQQLHGKAAATIAARVKAAFDSDRFPAPERLLSAPDAPLRAAGLSRNKLAALRDLATRTLDGTVPEFDALQAMSDDEIVKRLTVVRGIGRWTVEMMLIFRLGRPDVLPVDDYGVRKGFARIYSRGRMPSPQRLAIRGAPWAPFRSVAAWYLWRATEL
jgi:3-methyladenine DNA glycosylase/8-oxoguanine DNA glycosylase